MGAHQPRDVQVSPGRPKLHWRKRTWLCHTNTALDAELMVIQTTMHALRVAKMHPDMAVEAILAEITTAPALQ